MSRLTLVWDPLVRLFHWSLVCAFAVAWATGDEIENVHIITGYIILGLVGFRLVWGVIGTKYARFTEFVKPLSVVKSYLQDMLAGREKRYLGHNPAGGAMIVALLVGLALLGGTGWLSTTDMFWGSEFLEETHEVLANLLMLLVIAHVGGVIYASRRHKENLARAMVTGRKEDDLPHAD